MSRQATENIELTDDVPTYVYAFNDVEKSYNQK